MDNRQRVTIADVARHAGVSAATVSRVVNGRFAGEPEVAARVERAVGELSYAPSPLARSLALGTTQVIALVVPDLANPAFQQILAGLSKAAAKDGYRVLVADSAELPSEEPLLATEIRRRTDALVLCAPRMPEAELVALVDRLAPVVLLNRPGVTVSAPSLSIDYRSGVAEIAEHLYRQGHRRIAFVHGPESSASNANRELGISGFEREHGDVTVVRLLAGTFSDDGGAAAAAVRAAGVTAAIAFNDLVAIGLVGGLRELGVRVPEDISVTGFDDIPLARYLDPPLTTASVPYDELGTHAWRRVHAQLLGETAGHNMIFQPRMVVRESSAAMVVEGNVDA